MGIKDILLRIVSFFEGRKLKWRYKTAIVLCGYILAFLGACGAMSLYWLRTQGPDRQTYAAMYDFGDSLYFMGVLGFLSLFPTVLVLFFLRPYEKFWKFLSKASLLFAATGPLIEVINTVTFQMPRVAFWVIFWVFGLARLFISPLLFLSFLTCVALAPSKSQRRLFMVAALIEAVLILYVFIHSLIWHRFA